MKDSRILDSEAEWNWAEVPVGACDGGSPLGMGMLSAPSTG